MIKRGGIYLVNLNPIKGREQAGQRPVLVISSDAINKQPLVVSFVVGTDSRNVPRDYPTNVRVPSTEIGLSKDTVFLCFQIRSLDPKRFYNSKTNQPQLIGTMPPHRMKEIAEALKLALEIE
jgi:mRNA interferase MazF